MPGSQKTQREMALMVLRMVKLGFPITPSSQVCQENLLTPTSQSQSQSLYKEERERTQLHLQRGRQRS